VWCALCSPQKNCQSFGCCFFAAACVCVCHVNVNALCPAHLQRTAALPRGGAGGCLAGWLDGSRSRSSVLSRVSSSIDVDSTYTAVHCGQRSSISSSNSICSSVSVVVPTSLAALKFVLPRTTHAHRPSPDPRGCSVPGPGVRIAFCEHE